MYRSILISLLAGSMMTILSVSAQAQKVPEPASNLNLSKSNINRERSPPDGDSSGIAVNDPGMPAEKSMGKGGKQHPEPK